MFYVGQKVVCVDAKPRNPQPVPTLLNEGRVYTIASCYETWEGNGVTLKEVVSPYRDRPAWHADRFRPAVERKTDISVFTKMLKPMPVKEDA